MTQFNLGEIRFTVRGVDYVKSLEGCESSMIERAVAHAFKQVVGDAQAGKDGQEASDAAARAYANLNEWMRSEARTRATVPTAEAMFLSEARLFLRGKGVPKVADYKDRDAVEAAILKVYTADPKTAARAADYAKARVAKIESTVATRLAAVSDEIELD